MKISVLERLLSVESVGRRMTAAGEFAPPVVMVRPVSESEYPWVVSLSKGTFTLTRPNADGYIGQAFVECPLENEGVLLRNLYSRLWTLSVDRNWSNRVKSLDEAISRMTSFGFEPRNIAVPFSVLGKVCGIDLTEEEANRITLVKGCVHEINGIRIIPAGSDLSENSAIVSTAPALVGVYARSQDSVAITIYRSDRSMILVGDGVA